MHAKGDQAATVILTRAEYSKLLKTDSVQKDTIRRLTEEVDALELRIKTLMEG